jgi:hypothetical protein
VRPIITPRFVPSCSRQLLSGISTQHSELHLFCTHFSRLQSKAILWREKSKIHCFMKDIFSLFFVVYASNLKKTLSGNFGATSYVFKVIFYRALCHNVSSGFLPATKTFFSIAILTFSGMCLLSWKEVLPFFRFSSSKYRLSCKRLNTLQIVFLK